MPKLSVIIPSYNRRATLGRCLGALISQTLAPAEFEVIVADDGSTDGTAEMLGSFQTPFELCPLRLPHQGQAEALNAGIAAARGRVCLFLDDDVCASPELLAAHVAAHERDSRIIAIGQLTNEPPADSDWYARTLARAWNRHYANLAERRADWTDCYGGNLSVTREALLDLGGFSPGMRLNKDTELAFRLCQRGCRPEYVPGARAVHVDEKRRARLLRDSQERGAACVVLAEQRPGMLRGLLGWFGATTTREILLRRALIGTRVAPTMLALLGPLLPGQARQAIWCDFVARLAFWRGVRLSMTRAHWRRLTCGVPVLLYHAFGESDPLDRYVLPRRSFARQMWVLAALRYRMITLDDLAAGLRTGRLPPSRAAVITIDDGYVDNLEIAHPILRRRGFPATIFLVSGRTGERNDWSATGALRGRPLLSLNQIARVREESIRFGAHTRTHCRLPDVPDDQLREEVEGSRVDLERQLGTAIDTFSYPFGIHDERSVTAVESSGFVGACTTDPRLVRPGDNPSLIPRIEIRSSDSLSRFVRKLWFGGA